MIHTFLFKKMETNPSLNCFRYIDPEQIPVAYGGFLRENDPDFSIEDSVTEVTIKGGSSESIEILAPEVKLFNS